MSTIRPDRVACKNPIPIVQALFILINQTLTKLTVIGCDAGVSSETIYAWASNRHGATISSVEAVANVLGYTLVFQPLDGQNEISPADRILAAASNIRVD